MTRKSQVSAATLLMVLVCAALGMLVPAVSSAQSASLLGVAPHFDWSDYRASAKGRMFLSRLTSATLSGQNFQSEFVGPYLSDDPRLFLELIGTLYVDRLGVRLSLEDAKVEGRNEVNRNDQRYPTLDIGPTRVGFDLDIVRHPAIKLGVNLDYGLKGASLKHVRDAGNNQIEKTTWRSDGPLTIGLHGHAIPFRLKEVPAFFQARVRTPVPFLEQISTAMGLTQLAEISRVHILDWEVSAGLRPAIWDMSFVAHSTFSLAIEVGYRSFTIDAPLRAGSRDNPYDPAYPPKLDLHAHWQGAFFQAAFVF